MPKTETAQAVPSAPPPSVAGTRTTNPSGDASQAERDSYMQTAREDMDKLKGQLEELKTKALTSSADAKARLEKDIPSLEDQLKAMEKRFDELKSASATTWQQMKTAFSASMDNLKSAINKSGKA